MGAYMYPITIKKDPQKVRYTKEVKLDNDVLTLSELRKHVTEDEKFSVIETQESTFGYSYMLSISGERMETADEVAVRVAKEEKYMENYTEFHKNKNKK